MAVSALLLLVCRPVPLPSRCSPTEQLLLPAPHLLPQAIIHGVCSGGGPGLGAAPMPLRGKHLQNALAAAKGSIPLAVAKHKAAHQRVVMAGLHDASMQPMGLSDLVRMLLNHGAKVDARNVRGHTPLHMAAMKPHR